MHSSCRHRRHTPQLCRWKESTKFDRKYKVWQVSHRHFNTGKTIPSCGTGQTPSRVVPCLCHPLESIVGSPEVSNFAFWVVLLCREGITSNCLLLAIPLLVSFESMLPPLLGISTRNYTRLVIAVLKSSHQVDRSQVAWQQRTQSMYLGRTKPQTDMENVRPWWYQSSSISRGVFFCVTTCAKNTYVIKQST